MIVSIILNWISGLQEQSDWEREYENCVAVYKDAIWNLEPNNIETLPDYDRYVRDRQVANYMKSMEFYLNFVEKWKSVSGEDKTEVYRLATLFMIMVYETDHYEWYAGARMEKSTHYEFVYCNEEEAEEILDTAIKMQAESYPIDEGTTILLEESKTYTSHVAYEIYTRAAAAWEREFCHCAAVLYAELRKQLMEENVDDSERMELENRIKILDAYRDFTVKWAENNEEYARIDGGTGVKRDVAEARMQAFRTGTLILIWIYEQSGESYDFVYSYDKEREEITESCWKDEIE